MTLAPLVYLPGVCKVNSDYAASQQTGSVEGRPMRGRYRDMQNARFVAGFPEKLAGWATVIAQQVTGATRGMKSWRDQSQVVRLAMGTNQKLEYFGLNLIVDITPWRAVLIGTLTNPITTQNGSTTVNIAHTAHGLSTGDYVQLVAASAVGGVLVAGVYNPVTKVDANNYTIVVTSAASSMAGPGGGSVSYIYYRITLTNPFTTTMSSTIVTVAHTNNGTAPGDFVTIAGASAVGGLTLNGEYQIQTSTTNTYTINAATAASSSATGGGTPTFQYDISTGLQDSAAAFGYGTGGYGQNGYGTTGTTSIQLNARTWSIDNYGQQILCCPSGGTIYVWDPTIGGRAYPLYGAPAVVLFMLVTSERFVTALGIGSGYMQLAWADQTVYTNWVSSATNTANSGRTLQGGNYFVGGVKIRDQIALLSSDTNVFLHTYSGDNFVYYDTTSGDKCGFIGPLSATATGGIAYWMGQTDFWMFDGTVHTMQSDDIRDYVFSTSGNNPGINIVQAAKFNAGTNQSKKEVWFRYVSAAGTEIDSAVIYHIDQGCWSIAKKISASDAATRTSYIDRDLFPYPMATDVSGNIYQHEFGTDDNGNAMDSYIVAAPIDISSGDQAMDVMHMIPDVERQTGNTALSVLTRYYPNDTDAVDGPYTVQASDGTPLIDTRSNGKMAGFRWESSVVGGDYRLGVFRADVAKAGARR